MSSIPPAFLDGGHTSFLFPTSAQNSLTDSGGFTNSRRLAVFFFIHPLVYFSLICDAQI